MFGIKKQRKIKALKKASKLFYEYFEKHDKDEEKKLSIMISMKLNMISKDFTEEEIDYALFFIFNNNRHSDN